VLLLLCRNDWKCGIIVGIYECYNFRIYHFTTFLLWCGSWSDSVICANEDKSVRPRLRKRHLYLFPDGPKSLCIVKMIWVCHINKCFGPCVSFQGRDSEILEISEVIGKAPLRQCLHYF
jgi:hypothetical protein